MTIGAENNRVLGQLVEGSVPRVDFVAPGMSSHMLSVFRAK